MARSVILGNGSLTVGLNEQGHVNDFYYPYVGLDNLNTSRSMHHRIGLWIDGDFSWTDDSGWQSQVLLDENSLVSNVTMQNDHLGLKLELKDFVDWDYNVFFRRVEAFNLSDKPKTIRLFMHQVFEISRRGRGDTALYVPEEHYVLDYKGRCSLVICGQDAHGKKFDQYSVGNYGIEGKEGTFRDAEDGELSGNAVEHGGVDSVIRFSDSIDADGSCVFNYWIVAADSQYAAENTNRIITNKGLEERLKHTQDKWREWLSQADKTLPNLNDHQREALHKSLMVVKAHCDKRGGIIASCDSSIYNYGRDYYSYVWPRDGGFAIWPLIRLGYQDIPRRFFEFCRDIMHKDGYMLHKYQPDRSIGSTWHPLIHGRHAELAIQEDETAIVIFMLGEYLKYSGDRDFVFSLYTTLIQPAANFLARFIDDHTKLPHASYDLWEEKFLTSTFSTAVTYQALWTARNLAEEFDYPDDMAAWHDAAETIGNNCAVFFSEEKGYLRKGFLLKDNGSLSFDDVLDISNLYGAWKFGLFETNREPVQKTADKIEELLKDKSPSGGVPRYQHDHYFESKPAYLGNPWFVATLWLAQYYTSVNRADDAKHMLDWTLKLALPSGILSEQVDPTNSNPVSVTPLVWSHAELIQTLLDLHTKKTEE